MEKVGTILKELLAAAGIAHAGIERSTIAGQEVFSIRTDDARTLIGAHGDTVQALDFLVKKIYENQMPSVAESLIIHPTLQDAPNVKTESQGEGRSRRVVIKYSAV